MISCKRLAASWSVVLLALAQVAGQTPTPNAPAAPAIVDHPRNAGASKIIEEAREAAKAIPEEFSRGEVVCVVGTLQASNGEVQKAIATANECYPHTTELQSALGKYLAEFGTPARTKQSANALKHGSATMYYSIAEFHTLKDDFKAALEAAASADAPEVRAEAYARIALRQASKGLEDEASQTYALAASTYPREVPASRVDQLLLSGALERGDIDAARKRIVALASEQDRAIALLEGAEKLVSGHPDMAKTWIDEALKSMVGGERKQFLTYFTIPLLVNLGELEKAMAAAASLVPLHDFGLKSYTAIAAVCAERKDFACLDSALTKLHSAKNADSPDMQEFMESMMLVNIAAALIESGEYARADRLLERVEKSPESTMLLDEVQALRAASYAKQERFGDALASAKKIRSMGARDSGWASFRRIAALQTKKSGEAAPLQWARALKEPRDRAGALIGIAEMLLGVADTKFHYNIIYIH